MANFDWSKTNRLDGEDRYSGLEMRGQEAWIDLWRTLRYLQENPPSGGGLAGNAEDPWARAFDTFLSAVNSIPPPTGTLCRVFVSHRQADWAKAERVAYLATQAGFEYWLDIHDPALIAANGSALPSPAREILIAAIIEIGLLNSTHVLALHTAHSAGSKWIPYELGRAKQRQLFAWRACGWFDPSVPTTFAGEYTYLAARTNSDAGVQRWLKNQPGCAKSPRPWGGNNPPDPL